MSAIGALVTVGTVAALTGLASNAITSVIAQNAAKDADKAYGKENKKAQNTLTEGTADSQAFLDPYADAGQNALQQQQALSGALGPAAQQAAYDQIQNSPAYQAQMQASENSILSNASATGGLRGGNTQAALAGNAQQTLANSIAQQYGQFQGLSAAGQNAATNQAGIGFQGAQGVANLQEMRGQSRAGGVLGVANAQIQGVNGAANGINGILNSASTAGAI